VGTLLIVQKFLKYKRRELEFLPDTEVETHVEIFFRNLRILPLQSQYVLSLLLFVVKNKINSSSILISVTLIPDKNVPATSIHQIYHYQNESVQVTQTYLTISRKVSNI
jgi:hypothetical protein